MTTKLAFSFLFSISVLVAAAQDSCLLQVLNPLSDKEIFSAAKELPDYRISGAEAEKQLNNSLLFLIDRGYLTANYILTKGNGDTCLIQFDKGRKVYWAFFDVTGADDVFLNGAGYKKHDFENKLFRFDEVHALFKKMVQFAENHGYPFAVVKLADIEWGDSLVAAKLVFSRNYMIKFDTIEIRGNLNLNANYLIQYTGIHPGNLYDQSIITDLDSRLREMPFAAVTRPSQIEFSGESAKVVVFLDEKKVSRFDFLIGVLPNNEITGRIIITGEGKLDLENAFGAGESFHVYFSKLESTSKQFQSALTYPYFPGIPFGADGSFNLFLRDSTFLERTATLGILYHFTGSNYVKAYSSFYNSTVLTIDTNLILATKTLPAQLDNVNQTYGLNWAMEHLDYKFNPRKGFAFSVSGAAGTKTILENNSITSLTDPGFDFSSLYDSIDLKSLIVSYNYDVRYFIPILKKNTVLLQFRGASLINDYILQNELFRLGGNSLLRGFDEQSVLASEYHIFTAEYRFLFLPNSYAGIFFDGGYLNDKSMGSLGVDHPYGFGAGLTFETKAGIFGLSYALGARRNNPVEIKNAKIHFGYVNYF